MSFLLYPAVLGGKIRAVPSKSSAQRAVVCAANGDKPVLIPNLPQGEDMEAACRCFAALGAEIKQEQQGTVICPIKDTPAFLKADCGESGAAARFLLPQLAARGIKATVLARGRLTDRPFGPLLATLNSRGAQIEATIAGWQVEGRLRPGEFRIPGNISSQFISGLLLALPLLAADSKVRLTTPLQSADYVDMTCYFLEACGIDIQRQGDSFLIPGGKGFSPPSHMLIGGDWSNAAFWLTAGCIGSGAVTVSGLDPDSLQADRRIVRFLRRMGGRIVENDCSVTAFPSALRGCVIDLADNPDLLPPLAVAAAFARGETFLINAGSGRFKESDRIRGVAGLLRSLGGRVEQRCNNLLIYGTGLIGGNAAVSPDHRIVMAAAVAAASCSRPVRLEYEHSVAKSYPCFWKDYAMLGGKVNAI